MSIQRSVFSALLAFLALANTTSASTEACLPTNQREDGMNINFYEYALGDTATYTESTYMGYEYSDTKKLGSISGQTNLSINYSPPCVSIPTCTSWAVIRRDDGDSDDPCGEPDVNYTKRDDTDTEYCDPNTCLLYTSRCV